MFSRHLPLVRDSSQIEESNHTLLVKDLWHDSPSPGMEKVVRKLVWSKGTLPLVRHADSTFNWVSQSFTG